jgi:hypothetical protein
LNHLAVNCRLIEGIRWLFMVPRGTFYEMQVGNNNSSDRERRLNRQQEMIDKVINWLKEEGVNPQDLTHLRKDARYFGRIVTKRGRKTEDGRIEREKKVFTSFSQIQSLIA